MCEMQLPQLKRSYDGLQPFPVNPYRTALPGYDVQYELPLASQVQHQVPVSVEEVQAGEAPLAIASDAVPVIEEPLEEVMLEEQPVT